MIVRQEVWEVHWQPHCPKELDLIMGATGRHFVGVDLEDVLRIWVQYCLENGLDDSRLFSTIFQRYVWADMS